MDWIVGLDVGSKTIVARLEGDSGLARPLETLRRRGVQRCGCVTGQIIIRDSHSVRFGFTAR